MPDDIEISALVKIIGVDDIEKIAEKIQYRQGKFAEDFQMSLGVVLLNYGDSYVKVECVGKEWSGTKGELPRRDNGGIPLCPNGHPLFELTEAPQLVLIQEVKNAR